MEPTGEAVFEGLDMVWVIDMRVCLVKVRMPRHMGCYELAKARRAFFSVCRVAEVHIHKSLFFEALLLCLQLCPSH